MSLFASFAPWIPSRNVLVGLGVASAALLSYAVYFDYRRRSDPAFRKRIARERRLADAERASSQKLGDLDDIPLPTSPEEMEQYFVAMLQRGDQYIQRGPASYQAAAACFVRALQVYRQPSELLDLLQKTVPPPVFAYVVKSLSELTKGESKIQEIGIDE